jgi:hypothetical protein
LNKEILNIVELKDQLKLEKNCECFEFLAQTAYTILVGGGTLENNQEYCNKLVSGEESSRFENEEKRTYFSKTC